MGIVGSRAIWSGRSRNCCCCFCSVSSRLLTSGLARRMRVSSYRGGGGVKKNTWEIGKKDGCVIPPGGIEKNTWEIGKEDACVILLGGGGGRVGKQKYLRNWQGGCVCHPMGGGGGCKEKYLRNWQGGCVCHPRGGGKEKYLRNWQGGCVCHPRGGLKKKTWEIG